MELRDTTLAQVSSATAWDRLANPEALIDASGLVDVTVQARSDAAGPFWILRFDLRGKPRRTELRQTLASRPDRLGYRAVLSRLVIDVAVTLTARGREVTEIGIVTTIAPIGLRGRLMIPMLYLARGRIRGGLDKSLKRLTRLLEKSGRAKKPGGPARGMRRR